MTTKTTNNSILAIGVIFALGATGIFVSCMVLFASEPESFIVSNGVVEGAVTTQGFTQGSAVQFRHLQKSQTYYQLDVDSLSVDALELVDAKTGDVFLQKNSHAQHPLASLSKLVTTLFLFERGFASDSDAQVTPLTIEQGVHGYDIPISLSSPISKITVAKPETFLAKDLLTATLVASANNAAFALVQSQGLDEQAFQREVALYLEQNGFRTTTLIDPAGLHPGNISTADEYARLALRAFSYADIRTTTRTPAADISSQSSSTRIHVRTTDRLLDSRSQEILGGKTGYLDEAQYNFVVLTRHASGRELVLVMLGADSSDERFIESNQIIDWANQAFK